MAPPALVQFVRKSAIVFFWELKAFFMRPAAYVLLLAAAILACWSFSWLVTLLSRGPQFALRAVDDPIAQFLGPNVFLIGGCMLLIPLLTMNAIADERRRGTWETTVTAPISAAAIVSGKFFALWCVFLTCLAPWLYCLVVLRFWNGALNYTGSAAPGLDPAGLSIDLGTVFAGWVGLAVVGATMVALGIFCSGLCRTAASAAMLTGLALTAILLIGLAPRIMEYWSFSGAQVHLVESISCWAHVERFSRGTIEPRIIAVHASLCATLVWGSAAVARRVDDG